MKYDIITIKKLKLINWFLTFTSMNSGGFEPKKKSSDFDSHMSNTLKLVILVLFVFSNIIFIASAYEAIGNKSIYLLLIIAFFYSLLLLIVKLSKRNYKYGVATFMGALALAGLIFSANHTDLSLASTGLMTFYLLPIIGFMFFGTRTGVACILINIIPFVMLLSNFHLSSVNPYVENLPNAHIYVHSTLFLLFNICIPIATFKAIKIAKNSLQQAAVSEENLLEQKELYRALFNQASLPKVIINSEKEIIDFNRAFMTLISSDKEDIQNTKLDSLINSEELNIQTSNPLKSIKVSGKVYNVELLKIPFTDRALLTFNDVTSDTALVSLFKRHQNYILKTKHIDSLTQLPNRNWLKKNIKTFQQKYPEPLEIFTISVKNIDFIEQKFGVASRVSVLRQLSQYIQNVLFSHKVPSTVSLIDYDTLGFIELSPYSIGKDFIEGVIDPKIPKTLSHDGMDIPIEVKCGNISSEDSSLSFDSLVSNASYAAKNGSNILNPFNAEDKEKFIERHEISQYLPTAIENKEFKLVFQPKVDPTGYPFGFEALIRWHSPELGTIPPSIFIPIAEESGLISNLTEYVIEQVCAKLSFLSLNSSEDILPVSINISGIDIDNESFVQFLLDRMTFYNLTSSYIILELTETAMFSKMKSAQLNVNRLSKAGIKISLDDFGAGYSGLSKLVHFCVDEIKIDRQFVIDVEKDYKKRMLLTSILNACKSMKKNTLVEGIENSAQLNTLIDLGFDAFQGFGFSPPISEEELFSFYLDPPKPFLKEISLPH
ncbi:EAL domain-containing protein [Curvivirga sp.]|uniref:sensor domain-containing phosphodiesterase n=1 Tax=Curvivirga sp. TaxID=2856848 RepID=UPI003B5C4B94